MKDLRFMAALTAAIIPVFLYAVDFSWNGTTSDFQTGANWTPTGVPGGADNVCFTNAGVYGVSFSGDATNTAATVGAASPGTDAAFDLAGRTWQLGGFTFANTGTARFGGGTLQVGSAVSSFETGRNLILESGSARFGASLGTAGMSDGGTVEVHGGAHQSVGMVLCSPPAGGVSFRMTNGTYTSVANANNNSLTLYNAAKAVFGGGTFTHSGNINFYTTSSIDVRTNAAFIGTSSGANFNIGWTGGGSVALNIDGGTVSNNSPFFVGCTASVFSPHLSGTGLVSLTDGSLYLRTMTLASSSNAVGILRQSGGTVRSTESFYVGGASRALGKIEVSGGLFVTPSALFLGYANVSTGRLDVSGGEVIVSNTVNIGNNPGAFGEVNLSGGLLRTTDTLYLGTAAGGVGTLTFAGGQLKTVNFLCVGTAAGGIGQVNVTQGTSAFPNTVELGYVGGSTGRLTVTGGELSISNDINFGSAANSLGEITVSGGLLNVVGSSAFLRIGRHASGLGRVTVTGGTLYHAVPGNHGIIVGYSSAVTSELVIAGGMLTERSGSSLYVGWNPGTAGRVTISGGTNDFGGTGNFRIGGGVGTGGAGVMRISGGATYVTNTTVYVGAGSTATGRLELAGGTLTVKKIATSSAPSSKILFDGGSLCYVGNGASETAFVSGILEAALTDNGAVIDSNGDTVTIPQALSNEAGYAGSFTKKGAGKITLSSPANAFTGRVAVKQGELAVSGTVYLTGGVATDAGAVLNLASATVRDTMTASGTASRIDGTLVLPLGGVLTNGVGATLGGSGVITGSVVFASGSVYGRDKTDPTGALRVTGGVTFEAGSTIALTGYTLEDLQAGIPLLAASGTIQKTDPLAVTLDGVSHPYWRAVSANGGTVLTARVVPAGTMIRVF
jgi:autotransporter-associated beta strand protein